MNRLYLIVGGFIVALIVTFGIYSCHGQRVVDHAMQAAGQSHEVAVTQSAQAVVHDQAVQSLEPDLEKYKSEVARLKAKLAKITGAQPIQPPGIVDPGPVVNHADSGIAPGGATASDQLSTRDELIAAQDTQIKGLETQVVNLTLSRDSWKGAYEASTQEVASLRLAHAAQVAAINGARWKGRVEGFAVGIASGYLAGMKR